MKKKLKKELGSNYSSSKKMRKILESELSRLMSISVKYGDSLRKESMNYDEEYAKEVTEWRTSLELLSKEGNKDAKITIITYESLTCGHCADFHKKIYPGFFD